MQPSDWIDISVTLEPGQTPLWPGSPDLTVERRSSIEAGDVVNDSTLCMSVHTGTHIDAPLHFLSGGASTDQVPLAHLSGACVVVDLREHTQICASDLENAQIERGTQRILFKTDNSAKWSGDFDRAFVGLSEDAAQWLAERGVALVGIDYLSIQPFEGSNEVHRQLLRANTIILEGINLAGVEPGPYELLCLPLKLTHAEAAPARAVLRPL